MSVKKRIAIGLAWLATASLAQATEPTGTAAQTPRQSLIGPALSDGAGILKAGLLCIPKGRARVADFVPSEAAYRRIFEDAAYDKGEASSLAANWPTLTRIDANLCAKGFGVFGMGDKRSMSGRVSFTFQFSEGAGQVRAPSMKTVLVDRTAREAIPTEQYLPLAIKSLVDTLAP